MNNYKKLYNIAVLLILVGAFPISIASVSADLNKADSLICKFHNGDKGLNISCDHCDYFSELNDVLIYKVADYDTYSELKYKAGILLHYSLSSYIPYLSRSPPII
tara:strand:+ start:608 stop:922 length:315 start_codon:yes stop_codon:yes gene_type:complete